MKRILLPALCAALLVPGPGKAQHRPYADPYQGAASQEWGASKNPQAKLPAPAGPAASAGKVIGTCNFVVNGEFETQKVTYLQGSGSNIYNPSDPNSRDELAYWFSPNPWSPDHLATNSPVGYDANPASAYGGAFIPYNYNSAARNGCLGLINRPDVRYGFFPYCEYATEVIASPLRGDKYYYASMQVYSGSKSQWATRLGIDIAVDNPTNYYNYPTSGARFVVMTPAGCGIRSAGVVQASQWERVSGKFQGIAGAKYLTIGNFDPQDQWQLVRPSAFLDMSYHFIDHVEVYEIPEAAPAGASTGCTDDPVALGQGCHIPGAQYAWTASPDITFSSTELHPVVDPGVTTTYTLTVTLPDGSTHTSATTVTVCNVSCPQMYAIDVDDSEYCDQERIYLVPHFDPGPFDPNYVGTSGLSYTASGDIGGGSWVQYSPATGRPSVVIVPLYGRVQTYFTVEITYHYATGCTASYTYTNGWNSQYCQGLRPPSVSPNPAASHLTIEAPPAAAAAAPVQVRLYNSYGRLVRQGTSQAGQLSLDVQELPNGIYYVKGGAGKQAWSKAVEVRH
ncbi:T9SS type A sorting domain-containing protein [Hymenobacter edaphi]|uniref:Secretion system C-terminal sorting domain-containing protein n=1 Tax=Hymenobacter edaphi TaxID=2211146 RepID=A0A328BNN5_9BACT|nr:T9SS type A sorting domain-containing protein [Hymenobacter edaphi]RAK68209.1 hypothetical protein DLM85_09250 [Hymenobacter edaphi]